MNGQHTTDKLRHILFLLGLFLASASASAQVPVDDNGEPIGVYRGDDPADDEAPLLGAGELESLVGPVALYPDDLLAIVLPASTYPLQIVQAARFLEALEQDSALRTGTTRSSLC